jgi:hypothetical protein
MQSRVSLLTFRRNLLLHLQYRRAIRAHNEHDHKTVLHFLNRRHYCSSSEITMRTLPKTGTTAEDSAILDCSKALWSHSCPSSTRHFRNPGHGHWRKRTWQGERKKWSKEARTDAKKNVRVGKLRAGLDWSVQRRTGQPRFGSLYRQHSSLLHSVQTGYGAEQTSNTMRNRSDFLGGTAAGSWSWPLASI